MAVAESFAELREMSASKGGMEKTVVFKYDEHVSVVMAAFRERSQGPHPSMPLVRRVDILDERPEKPTSDGTDTEAWAMRYRRFFAANDAPEWVKKISGGEYLTGTERIEWSEPAGKMVMYTVNESHSQLVTAEEICVIEADPERPHAGTIKTLTVRARLRLRGWWTLGISAIAERFLLGRYTKLVLQGKKIELEEIAKWRATGKAESLLRDAVTRSRTPSSERALERVLARAQKPAGVMPESNDERGTVSPTSTLAWLKSNPSVDGLEVESLEEFERSMMDFPSTDPLETTDDIVHAGLSEDQWLMLRYAKRQDELLNASSTDSDEYAYAYESTPRPESPLLGYTSTDEDEYQYEYESTPRPESPLYVPLTDDDEDEEEDGDGDEETPAADAVIDDEFRSSGSPGAASPIDAWSPGGERTVLDVSVNEAEIAKSFAKDWEEIERLEQEAIRLKLGLDPEDETGGGAFGGLRKWLVRLALVGAGAAILRERKDQLLPLAARAKRKWTHRKRVGAKPSVIETKAVDENVEDTVDEFEEEGDEVEDAATSEVDAADSE
jgi:hypothetical protein